VFLFFAVIAAALVIAVLIGGDVRRLSQLRIRHLELLFAAFAVKVAVAVLGAAHSQLTVNIARPLNVIGACLLLAVVWFNRRIPGAILFGAGLTLNLVVIVAFGGRMPVLLPSDIDPSSAPLALLKGGLDPLLVGQHRGPADGGRRRLVDHPVQPAVGRAPSGVWIEPISVSAPATFQAHAGARIPRFKRG